MKSNNSNRLSTFIGFLAAILSTIAFFSLALALSDSRIQIQEKDAAIIDLQSQITFRDGYIKHLEERLDQRFSQNVEVTAYCDNDANTSIGADPEPGTCAMPTYLLKDFPYGTEVLLEGIGVYLVNNTSGSDCVDIWIGNCTDAKDFGIKRGVRMTRIMQ